MKKEDIMDGVGEIDEKIVAETASLREKKKGGRRTKILFSVIAAVLVLSVAAAAVGILNVTRYFVDKTAEEVPAATGSPEDVKNVSAPTGVAKDAEPGARDLDAVPDGGDAEAEIVGKYDKVEYGEAAKEAAPSYSKSAIDAAPAEEIGEGGEVADDLTVDDGELVDVLPHEGEGGAESENYGDAFVLTASEWRDLDNWPFFLNLVNSETITFPAYGLDPTHLCRVTVKAEDGSPLCGERVELLDSEGDETVFAAVTDKTGTAYLFWDDGVATPGVVACGDVRAEVTQKPDNSGTQGTEKRFSLADDVTLTVTPSAPERRALQVSFIIDTTGSMSDELAYLQKDFASIAEEVGTDGVFWSVNFYRDEGDDYVTKCNPFTDDVDTVKSLLMGEYCDGGGDFPEAVDQILRDAITDNGEWADDCEKIAFLIFDASPHEGTDATIVEAVRSAAARGIRIIPVVASGSQRDTELFGRAAAILTGGTYVFLTDDSGVGNSHLEPIIGDHKVELLHDIIVRIISEHKAG